VRGKAFFRVRLDSSVELSWVCGKIFLRVGFADCAVTVECRLELSVRERFWWLVLGVDATALLSLTPLHLRTLMGSTYDMQRSNTAQVLLLLKRAVSGVRVVME
jgi:hypothetical protein